MMAVVLVNNTCNLISAIHLVHLHLTATIYSLLINILFSQALQFPFFCFNDFCSSSNQSTKESELGMGFIMEFAENLILRMMEDPRERDRKFREHLYDLKDRCQKTKEMWSLPMRPYGFWTFERHNSQLAWDAQISNVPGRRDPYDDLLEDRTTKL